MELENGRLPKLRDSLYAIGLPRDDQLQGIWPVVKKYWRSKTAVSHGLEGFCSARSGNDGSGLQYNESAILCHSRWRLTRFHR